MCARQNIAANCSMISGFRNCSRIKMMGDVLSHSNADGLAKIIGMNFVDVGFFAISQE